jgi:hypothetical protein
MRSELNCRSEFLKALLHPLQALRAIMVAACFVFCIAAYAEEASQIPSESASASASSPEVQADVSIETPKAIRKVVQSKSKGSKRTREKDADGSQAPDRFQADTVIKSQYKLNGQPLEVDPD